MALEIEMRARFDRSTHERLLGLLQSEAEDLGSDDKDLYFYVLPDMLLKVVDNVAAGTAKVSLKENRLGRGVVFPETEFTIDQTDVPLAVRVFDRLGFGATMHRAFNARRNFRLGGVEIALKWSEAWGHHAEFEVLLDEQSDDAEQAAAVRRIRDLAEALGVELMSERELADFTAAFEAVAAPR